MNINLPKLGHRKSLLRCLPVKAWAAGVLAYSRNVAGSSAIMFAVGLPASMGAVGIGIDFSVYSMKHNSLQSAADQAALAGAKQFAIASADEGSVQSAAENFAKAALGIEVENLTVKAKVDASENKVKVTIEERWTPFFAHFLKSGVTPIIADATAGLFGESKICVLALGSTEIGVVSMTKDSHLKASGCTIYSNSSNSASVFLGDVSSIEADAVCTVGGVKDNGSLNGNRVVTDCPVLADPLADRPPPIVGPCKFNDVAFIEGEHDLEPGVYCGGIRASGAAVLNFAPGDYIIKDGLFTAFGKAALHGKNVGFYLTGGGALMRFQQDATIDLTGREEGLLAGMLIYDDPKPSMLRIHSISASNAHTLTGTIYIPKGNLVVDPAASVGERSAYTAIVAKRLVVQNGPTLVLNTDYDSTPVPVPEGIRASADIHLID